MTIAVTFSQFLFGNGVPVKQAEAVGTMIASKIRKRQPLTPDEAALAAAYLRRAGANEVAERHVGIAIITSNMRSPVDQHSAGDILNASTLDFSTATRPSTHRIPVHTPEWTHPRPGDPGNASDKQKAQTVGATETITVGAAQTESVGQSAHGWDPETKELVAGKARSEIRMLSDRIAADLDTTASSERTQTAAS